MTELPSGPSCATCRFGVVLWNEGDEFTIASFGGRSVKGTHDDAGIECRRHSPPPEGWPRAKGRDWCGEYAPGQSS